MARKNRDKLADAIYHITIKCIEELYIFDTNTAKKLFLNVVAKYQNIYGFKIYAYCIMSNHAHLLIDTNGADMSKFMQCICLSYAKRYNIIHNRKGHVFGDRFFSELVADESYLVTVTNYIHKNPSKIKAYENCYENYGFSSINSYMNIDNAKDKVLNSIKVDPSLVLNAFNNENKLAKDLYFKFLKKTENEKDIFLKERYRNKKLITEAQEALLHDMKIDKIKKHTGIERSYNPQDVISFVANSLEIKEYNIKIKFKREASNFRALCALLFKSFCNIKTQDITKILGCITPAEISYLSSKGYNLVITKDIYSNLIYDFTDKFLAPENN
ncbi:MAG: transposase [Clostridiaceae bacterium]